MKIRIIEECTGINRRTGERSTKQTDDKSAEAVVGAIIRMTAGGRNFTVDEVNENGVIVTVCPENNPDAAKTLEVVNGESTVHRPRSLDGGYRYTLILED